MSLLAFLAADDITQTPSKFWPEGYEMLFGIPASVIVFFLLWKFAGPTVKKGMAARTAKIQAELDAGEADRVAADAEAAKIRQAKGDIAAERARLLAEADAQAAALLEDGRARLAQEVAELEARAAADLAAAAARSGDELTCRDCQAVERRSRSRRHRLPRRGDAASTDRELHRHGRSRRRSQHMSDSRIEGYARGLFEIARAEGTIDEVEDELFRFARSYESSEELRNALSDEQIPASKRQAIVEDLLGGKVTPTTTQLISMVVGSGRARDLPAIVDKLVARASTAKNLEVAEVRTAVPLTPDQETRLAAALANATGKEVNLKVVVDPSVLGGLVATVGDTVIDGTVRTRIEQLKSRL